MSTATSNTITCSIRVNANTKRIFDAVCERIGAYNIFTNAVANQQRIPFEVTATPVNIEPKPSALDEMRADLEQRGLLKDYTLDEINELIAEARNYPLTQEDKEFIDQLCKN